MNPADPRARRYVLMLGTSPTEKGGIAAVVGTLSEAGFFETAQVRYVATHVETSRIAKVTQFALAVAQTFAALCSGRVALVHAHVSSGASFWRKAVLLGMARACGVPTIFHLHSGAFDAFAGQGGRLRAWAVRRTLQSSDVVVVLSERWGNWVQIFAPGSVIRVIPNPVNVPTVVRPAHAPPQRRALYLGLISEAKGTFDLLRAWAQFRRDVPGWRLAIGGNGAVDLLMSESKRLGVDVDVDFLGWITGSDKARELNAADIFVLPSYREGMPVSILEAMAFGAAVVATPVGGVPDMMRDEVHGLLVRPGDIAGLSGALVRLATSDELRHRLAGSARVHVREHYATDMVVRMLCDLYGAVAERRMRPSP